MKLRNIVYLLLFSVIMMSFGLSAGDWTGNFPDTSFNSYESMKYIEHLVINLTNTSPITSDDFRIEVIDTDDKVVFAQDYVDQINFDISFILNDSAGAGKYEVKIIDQVDDVSEVEKEISVSFTSLKKSTSIDEKTQFSVDTTKRISKNDLLETERASFDDVTSLTIDLTQINSLEGSFLQSSIDSNDIVFTNTNFTRNGNSEYEVEYDITYDGNTFEYSKNIVIEVNERDAIIYLAETDDINLETKEDTSITIPINSSLDDNGNVVGWFYDDDTITSLSYLFEGSDCTGSRSGSNFVFTPSENYNGNCNVEVQIKDRDYLSSPITLNFDIVVNSVDDVPVLTVESDSYQFYEGQFEDITIDIEDPDTTTFSYSVNGEDQPSISTKEIVLTSDLVGTSSEIIVSVYHNETVSVEKTISIEWVDAPTITNFNVEGNFSDPSNSDIQVSRSGLSIDWVNTVDLSGTPVDLSNLIDFEEKTSGTSKDVLLHVLSGSVLDGKANISLTGYNAKPIVSCASGKVTEKKYLRENCSGLTVNFNSGNVWFEVDHFSTYRIVSEDLLNTAPVLNETSTITVDEDTTTYQLNAYDADGDSIAFSVVDFSNEDVLMSSTGLLSNLDELSLGSTYSFEINMSDGYETVTGTFTLKRVVEGKLEIIKLNVNRDNEDDYDDLSDGDTIKAKPGETIDLELELENKYSNSDDIDLDGTVYITIYDIDDGDDLDFEKDFDIDASGDDKLSFDIDIPLFTDEDTDEYDVNILVEYEDEDGNSFEDLDIDLTLDLDRDSTHLVFSELELSPAILTCEERFTLSGEVVNVGTSDRNIIVQIKSSDLGIQTNLDLVEVEKYAKDDNTYSFSKAYIAKNLAQGDYYVSVYVYYDNDIKAIGEVKLTKGICSTNNNNNDDDNEDDENDEEDSDYEPVEPIITDGNINDNIENNDGISTTTLLVAVLVLLGLLILVVLLLPEKK